MIGIKINGNDNSVLSVRLKDILECLPQDTAITWAILNLEAVGYLEGSSMVEFENKIRASNNEYRISFHDLSSLAKNTHQEIELGIIGCLDPQYVRRYNDSSSMYLNCDYSIELMDSSFWIIHSSDSVFIEKLFKRLDGVSYIVD